jgi:spore coat polysaccharide biosynthesis predicted glycosyltransferase SpsG
VPTVGLRCDADTATGVGHLVRCVALAEELLGRGVDAVFLGDLGGLPFVVRQLEARGLTWRAAPKAPQALADLAMDLGLDAVVLDGYHLDPGCGRALQDRGLPVLAIADGDFGTGQSATLYLDQNLGAVRPAHLPPGVPMLSGLGHVLLRDAVRRRRPAEAAHHRRSADGGCTTGHPRVLAVFGGTDPYDAVRTAVPLLLATGRPLELRAIVSRTEVARALRGLPLRPGQRLILLSPVDDLPALVVESDLVVSASGSSLWELLCLGVPAAAVCVTDNQEAGYLAVVRRALVAGLGRLEDLTGTETARRHAVATLAALLADDDARAALAARGLREVDGRGRERVADALCAQIAERVSA